MFPHPFVSSTTIFARLRRVGHFAVGLVAVGFTGPVARGAFPTGSPASIFLTGQNFWLNPPDSAYPIIGASGVTMMRIGGKAYDDTPLSDDALLKQVDNIHGIGAEPLIQVSRYKGAATAAATVNFLNVTHRRAVKYWCIGNEPDQNWTGTEADLALYVAGYTKPIASAMRDVDPTISISAADMAFYSTVKFDALLGGAADITGRDAQGRYYVDGINFHRYPFANVITRSAVLSEMHGAFESRVSAFVNRLAFANALQGRTGAAALTWGLTEFNLTYNNPATSTNNIAGLGVSAFLNGQFFAEYYRVGLKYGAHRMNTWSLLEGGGSGSSTDFGYLGGSWSAPVMRSSFYHLQMVANYLLPGGYLPAVSTSANLAVLGTISPNRALLSIMLLNEDTSGQQTFTLRLNDEPVAGPGNKINVSAGLPAEFTGTIENQSTVILRFDAAGALQQRIVYSLARNLANQPPQVETFPIFTRLPSAPSDLSAAGGDAQVVLTWVSPGATACNVQRAPAPGGPSTTIARGVMATSFTDTGLTDGVAYRYTVSAVNPLGESARSAPATATPEARSGSSFSFEAEALGVTASGSATSVNADSAASGGSWVQLNAADPTSAMEFTTGAVSAGSYRLQLIYKANNNRGRASLAVDGLPVGETLDQYAGAINFTTVVIGRVTFASAGTHTIRLSVVGKNPASSGYLLSADQFALLAPEPATLALGNLLQVADGAPKSASASTTPAALPVALTYDGSSVAPTAAGTYTVAARIMHADYFGAAGGTLTITTTPRESARLSNASVRTTLSADQILIVGLNMSGGSKPVLLRAAGPSLLPFGVTNAMSDPRIALYRDSAQIAANDNWAGLAAVSEAAAAIGAFPFASSASLDSALLVPIDGGRTVHVSGPLPGNVVVEAYDAGTGDTPRLTNLSARNQVGRGADVLIAGFIVAGSGTKTLLIRAAGPALGAFGVTGVLSEPKLELFTSTNPAVKIAENDAHSPALAGVFMRVGAFAFTPGSKDAAILIDLPAGAYTAQVSGADGGIGAALVEIYEVP